MRRSVRCSRPTTRRRRKEEDLQHAASAWFDEEAALDAATVQFRSHGYEATSVSDLAATMGLTAESQYNALATSARSRNARSNDTSSPAFATAWGVSNITRGRAVRSPQWPRGAIAAVFDEIFQLSEKGPPRKGCLIRPKQVATYDGGERLPHLIPRAGNCRWRLDSAFRPHRECTSPSDRLMPDTASHTAAIGPGTR
ncbi:hypothetical protein AWB74_08036 [Caballeronia arvi]|uniref:Uncharacterized protein n=1 Tax=Caballeronia arvi TaxID=1777135 RepID=A0A158L2S0_9BURK|nr:hypothetical protein AWB74_08036 [Caballeronia arvi]